MKKTVSIILSIVMIVNVFPFIVLVSSAAANCPKGHAYVQHYCKTCNVYEKNYTGLAKKNTTWYYVNNGTVDKSFTGLAKNDYGWWYVKNGTIDFKYNGMSKNQYGWWYVKDGKVDTTYKGMAKNDYGWWYLEKGTINFNYSGMAKNDYGWWYIKKGKLDLTFTGISNNYYGSWYLKNGKLDTTYNGIYTESNGTRWKVTNGKAVRDTTTPSMGVYEVDPVYYGFANPIGTIKKGWVLKNPDGRNLSELGLDIRVSRVELNKTVTQNFNKSVSSQIANPKTISYKPTCSVAIITCKDSDPTHIKVTENYTMKAAPTPEFAQSVSAIIAVNNQTTTGGANYEENCAAVIRNGRLFKSYTGDGKNKHNRLIMYKNGDWKIGTLDSAEAKTALANGAYNSFYIQDITIRDGKITAHVPQSGIYRNRTFFGRISATKYVMMVSEYMPMMDAANVLLAYGCKDAVLLQGGNCTFMYVNKVGNTTGMTGASVRNLNKIGFLETEWMASKGLLAGNAGGGPCAHELDVLYVK